MLLGSTALESYLDHSLAQEMAWYLKELGDENLLKMANKGPLVNIQEICKTFENLLVA